MSTGASWQPLDDKEFFGHPKGLRTLFFTELWERFSFYGMRALLVLYMINKSAFGYTEDRAYAAYAAYGALVYAFPVLGGWLANRWLGYRNAVVLGAVFMAAGQFALAIPNETAFYLALSLLCVGNGFFKPNISSNVGRLYAEEDARRDRGFTIFYMSINIGALLAPIVCGNLGEKVAWSLGFAAAGFGMLIGLVWYLFGQRHLGTTADPDHPELLQKPVILGLTRLHFTWLGALAAVPLAAHGLSNPELGKEAISVVAVLVALVLIYFLFRLRGTERYRLLALMLLMGFHTMFFAGFEQAGSSFNVLADKHVDRVIFGLEVPASVFQAVNPMFIVLLTPVFVWMWRALTNRGRNPSIPTKFVIGLILLGVGFYILSLASRHATTGSDGIARFALVWLILCYFLHTTGELFISPIGLSAVTTLAPRDWVGFCMGAWFLTISFGHQLAGFIARLTGTEGGTTARTSLEELAAYGDVYRTVFHTMLVAAAILLALTPIIKRLIRGVENSAGLRE
jgi:POT family proton-dependent oligopeptide transporter